MKFSLSWLAEALDTEAPLARITETLTMIGLEVEAVEDRAAALKEFVVAEVVDARPHPDADRLQICTVDAGGVDNIEVVCGAPNARTGMKGVFAAAGCYIPGIDTLLKTSKIRGVTSNGMLLSERELGLSDEHEGIVELSADAPIGAPAAEFMGLADAVIDIAITPNRGDCLGVRGIARDLAAAGLGTLKPLEIEKIPGAFESAIKVHLDFDAGGGAACPYFVGRLIRGIKNVDSPAWLRDKLTAIGLRPISALVDITNLLTIAHGRPLHVFDADRLAGDIHVRLAKAGESLLALDGKEYALDADMTVIADETAAQGLGGVMGGAQSGVTEATVNVFVESAYFDPRRTAATGRKLNLQSDARFRFERGIDPTFLEDGMELATKLILEICGGEASELVVAGGEPEWRRSYFLRRSRVKDLAGVDVAGTEIEKILGDLGFSIEAGDGGWTAHVPPWRHDIAGEADLVEEVIRIHGFDKIPITSLARESTLPGAVLNTAQRRRATVRRALAGRGLAEAVTYSFISAAEAERFGGFAARVRLVNPISADLDVMRPSLLPNLISAAGRNADRGTNDVALFEVGPQFADETPAGESTVAAGLRAGAVGPRNWTNPPRPVDAYDAKADALAAIAALGGPVASLQITPGGPDWYHPGRAGALSLGPNNIIARFGEIHPGVLAAMGVAGPMAAFEVFLDNLPLPKAGKGPMRPHLELPSFQPVARDFAFVLGQDVAAETVVRAARGADKKLITDIRVFDVFTGGGLDDGQKSLAINVTLQPRDKTLTDAEIEFVAEKIVKAVEKATGGTLRG